MMIAKLSVKKKVFHTLITAVAVVLQQILRLIIVGTVLVANKKKLLPCFYTVDMFMRYLSDLQKILMIASVIIVIRISFIGYLLPKDY